MAVIDVIKYEGDNSTFIWKHPREDFNKLSQLIVHESQEALFFMNGQALDLFGPGRYPLESQNIPLLNKLVKIPTGGESLSIVKSISLIKLNRWRLNGDG